MEQETTVVELTVGRSGELTLPEEIRDRLGVAEGGRIRLVSDEGGVQVSPLGESKFEQFRGWGNGIPDLGTGDRIKEIVNYVREMRGHDEFD